MKARRREFLRQSERMQGHIAGVVIRAAGMSMACLGFCFMAAEVVSYFQTGYWTATTVGMLLDALQVRWHSDYPSMLGSIAYDLKDAPIGLGCIGAGLCLATIGNIVVDLAKGRFYSRLLEK